MKKLIGVESVVDENSVPLALGEAYSYFQDPETGKFYRPRAGCEVEVKDSHDWVEVEAV